MNTIWLILLLGTGVYALRFAGLALPNAALPPVWERSLGFVPPALLTALVVASLAGPVAGGGDRWLAAAGAAAIVRMTGRMWACILGGMGIYWLLRAV
ncbi:MAG: hypothetical protein AVDCRST_MAG88-3851 [uncultured Thermomicrobiales bacterium]|uniref:Branched-chain amino acid transport n=1 Tax=uncultured Thermomicrobiales bacterium TaxID=1645740 RepID=A0A6J4VU22_9BACT|nr:MAG: hypothetical protein AVDCRST_MAG88-3851 [uncultured Thermomicrobiales bacterium]